MPVIAIDEQITQKVHQLNAQQKQVVSELVDVLLKLNPPTAKTEKELSRLLDVSIWSESDIQEIERAQQNFNSWTIQGF